MASEQWLLNDTSVASNAYFTAVGSSYKLRNVSAGTYTRRTTSPTPYEGAGYYASGLNNDSLGRFYTSGSVQLTGGTYYTDAYFYLTGYPSVDVLAFVVTGDDTNVLYTWAQIDTDGSFSISSYDAVNGPSNWTSSSNSILPTSAWFRIAYKTNASGVAEVKLYKGTGINGTTADATLTKDFTAQYPFSAFGAWEYQAFAVDNTGGSPAILYADNIKFDNTAYPTRGTAYTADASSTITATGTATMSNARVVAGSATITATGTSAANNARVLDGSSTVTATGTSTATVTSLSSITGSSTITGTGTATAASTQKLNATATITSSGTATATVTSPSLKTADATSTVTATGTVTFVVIPPVTIDGRSTIVADGSATVAKSMQLNGTANVTATAQAGMTHGFYIFRPPTREIAPLSLDPYAEIVGYYQGKTLVKRDGVWKVVQNKRKDWLDECEYVFLGGRENRVTGTQKSELEAQGYTVETSYA